MSPAPKYGPSHAMPQTGCRYLYCCRFPPPPLIRIEDQIGLNCRSISINPSACIIVSPGICDCIGACSEGLPVNCIYLIKFIALDGGVQGDHIAVCKEILIGCLIPGIRRRLQGILNIHAVQALSCQNGIILQYPFQLRISRIPAVSQQCIGIRSPSFCSIIRPGEKRSLSICMLVPIIKSSDLDATSIPSAIMLTSWPAEVIFVFIWGWSVAMKRPLCLAMPAPLILVSVIQPLVSVCRLVSLSSW